MVRLRQTVATAMAFIFLVTPLAPVFAEEPSEAPVESESTSDVMLSAPETSDTSVPEAIPETTGTPTEAIVEDPVTEEMAPEPKEEDPVEELPKKDGGEEEPMAAMSGGSGNPTGGQEGGVSTIITPEPDQTTGALTYAMPIVIPPGRNGMQPDVKLSYNSQEDGYHGFFGAGWDVPIPSIRRLNRKGTDKMYTEPVFASSVGGELVETASGTYKVRTETGDFSTYTLSSNVWTVTDRKGNTYKYGSASSTRQDNADGSKIFKWMLEEIRDPNDNYVEYEYFKDQNQIYPSKIRYTGSGSTDGPFEVEFLRESRNDSMTSYEATFASTMTKRVSEIQVKIDGSWVRKYALGYTNGQNGNRSLLSTVTESGKDESSNVTTLPPVTFGYQVHSVGWNGVDPVWKVPKPFVAYGGYDAGGRLFDVNGDALPDFVDGASATRAVYLNNGSNWNSATSTVWTPPLPSVQESAKDAGTRFADVNADGLIDMIYARDSAPPSGYPEQKVYINSATGWTLDTNWSFPESFTIFAGTYDYGVRLADVNGDGLPDVLRSHIHSGIVNRVYINTGSGWTLDSDWKNPDYPVLFSISGADSGARLTDINADGLVDLIWSQWEGYPHTGAPSATYINNGRGWTRSSTDTVPLPINLGYLDWGTRPVDANGDGLADLLMGNDYTGSLFSDAYIASATGWARSVAWVPSETFVSSYKSRGLLPDDADGDGLVDLIYGGTQAIPPGSCADQTPCPRTYLNKGKKSDFLSTITYPQGGKTEVVYSTPQKMTLPGGGRANTELPVTMDVVQKVTHSDGLGGTPVSKTYLYEGGKYWRGGPQDKRFAGFAAITATDSASNTSKTFFHQADATDSSNGEYDDNYWKIGRPYRTERRDASGNLYDLSVQKWESTDLGNGRAFAYKTRSTGLTYDGDSDHKDKAETYGYDTGNGNLTSKVEWGEVTGATDGSFSDTGSDKRTTTVSYVTTGGFTALPKQETLTDQSSTTVRDSKFYYDTQSHGSATDGNLTKQEGWVSGGSWINSQKTYNGYGLVTQETDPRGKTTTYAYDAKNIYPVTATNPLSHVTQMTYDYSLGRPKEVIDPNLLKFQTVFDGLDRVLAEKQPDQSTTSTMVTKSEYLYTDTPLATNIKKMDWLDGSNGNETRTYLDGLGRPIQVRQESESSYAVSDVVYGSLGLKTKESLPYFSATSARTTATSDATLYTTHVFDALKRPATDINAVATTTYAYDDWQSTATDALGNVKRLYRDAFGRLNKVDEVMNATNTYVTTYAYDQNDNLTNITDALANVRNFNYDSLNRRLTAQDLHASGDGTYGTWTYGYDDAGNLTSSVDPKSQTVNYVYDDLNRPTSEDLTSASGTEVTYTYDACQYGKGRLCSSTNSASTIDRLYGPTGQVVRETKTIGGTGYQTDTTYDRQGNVLTMTEPDSSQVQNVYNDGGLLEKVQRKEPTDGSWKDVVSNFDWSPVGKPTLVAYANSATTTNTYDAISLYRLTSKVTIIPGGDHVQDISYTYDAVGNITNLVDASQTATNRAVIYTYDALDRLLAAVAYETGSNPGSPAPPNTSIFSGPTAVTWSATATLVFASNDVSATFACKLDSGSWTSCTSPLTYSGLSVAAHTFSVRATNANGTDASPATLSWTVTSTPSVPTSVALTASGGCEYGASSCGTTSAATLPLTISAATDQFLIVNFLTSTGCTGTFPATYDSATMTLATSMDMSGMRWRQYELAGPNQGTHNAVVTMPWDCGYTMTAASFSSVDQTSPHGTTVTGSGGTGNTPTVSVTGTTDGLIHSAIAAPNNSDAAPVSPLAIAADARSAYWPAASATVSGSGTVATTWSLVQHCCAYWGIIATPLTYHAGPPETAISSGPSTSTWSATATFAFASPDAGATFECQLDAGGWSSCSSPLTYSSLAVTSHTFYVRATNANGIDASPATLTWTVTSPPSPPSQPQGQGATYAEYYAYDALGDMLSKVTSTAGSATTTKTYAYASTGNANPHAATSVGGTTYAYDHNGNLSTRASDLFAWDYKNRLLSAFVNGTTSTYAYDSEGNRVNMTAGATSTAYASDWYSLSGGMPTKHIFAGGMLIATVEGTTSTAVVHYIHTDHLTGSSIVTSATGTVQEALDYNPYGDVRVDEKSTNYAEVRQFAGHEFDPLAGLTYMRARYYDPALGRFLSEDPAFLSIGDPRALKEKTGTELEKYLSDPQGLNSYAYARNNPLLYVDPDGKWFIEFALSGKAFGVSGSGGLRIDSRGIDLFGSIGVSVGASLGGIKISSGDLSHEPEVTVSRSGSAALLVGLELSLEGDADSADPLGLEGGRNQSGDISLIVGGAGGAASQDRTYSIPLMTWSDPETPREETIGPRYGNSTQSPSPGQTPPTASNPSYRGETLSPRNPTPLDAKKTNNPPRR